jgi:hypothetical protein
VSVATEPLSIRVHGRAAAPPDGALPPSTSGSEREERAPWVVPIVLLVPLAALVAYGIRRRRRTG